MNRIKLQHVITPPNYSLQNKTKEREGKKKQRTTYTAEFKMQSEVFFLKISNQNKKEEQETKKKEQRKQNKKKNSNQIFRPKPNLQTSIGGINAS